jgi:hypothetical protein
MFLFTRSKTLQVNFVSKAPGVLLSGHNLITEVCILNLFQKIVAITIHKWRAYHHIRKKKFQTTSHISYASSNSKFHKPTAIRDATPTVRKTIIELISHHTSPKIYVTSVKQQHSLSQRARQDHANYPLFYSIQLI